MGMLQVTWTPPSGAGSTIVLHGGGPASPMVIEHGCTGMDMPPVTVDTIAPITSPGEMRTGVKIEPREMSIPVLIRADDIDRQVGLMVRAMSPAAGAGVLRVISEEADRMITCSLISGLEGDDSFEVAGHGWVKVVLHLRAHAGYWEDSTVRQVTFREDAKRPFFPLSLGSDAIVLNPNATFGTYYSPQIGDLPSYPRWRFNGPFDGFEVSNSAGEAFRYGQAYPANNSMEMSFDPLESAETYTNGGAVSYVWRGVIWPSQLWSIRSGAREVSVSMSGATTATYTRMSWRARWLSWRSVGDV